MSYATVTFLGALLATVCIYFIVPKKLQLYVLLTASLAFYMLSCGIRVIFLLLAAAVLYGSSLIIERLDAGFAAHKKAIDRDEIKTLKKKTQQRKKAAVFAAVTLTLLMLIGTKYFNFLGDIVNHICGFAGYGEPVPVLKILMPLGISYYTLMGISYITDRYRGTAYHYKNPLLLLLYLGYFPHIVEGPFDRYDSLCSQLREPHYFDYDNVKNGGIRFIWGIFKKVVVADRAGLIVNTIFSDTAAYSGSVELFAVILYTLQIYAEFSGCMDMVCGASQMLGIRISENFRRPFFSASINEFWRRWHITLGAWLKDYVFYPVSLSGHFKKLNSVLRKHISSRHLLTLLPNAYALFFVWFCNGLWHGASVKYIVYGLYYYVLMMLGLLLKPVTSRFLAFFHISKESAGYHAFEVIRTCVIVAFGMMIFRSETLGQAWNIFSDIFTDFNASQLFTEALLPKGISGWDYLIIGVSFLLLLAVSVLQEKNIALRNMLQRQALPVRWTVYLVLMFSIIIFGAYGGDFTNTAFIYEEF